MKKHDHNLFQIGEVTKIMGITKPSKRDSHRKTLPNLIQGNPNLTFLNFLGAKSLLYKMF